MPVGTPYVPDTIAVHVNGVVTQQTAAQLATTFGAGNIRTASRDFTFPFKGHTVSFSKNVPVVVSAELAAALAASGAPVS